MVCRLAILIPLCIHLTLGDLSPLGSIQRPDPRDVTLNSNSPYRVAKHLDNTIEKSTKNVTQNPEMAATLYQISHDLVGAILSKLDIQDKITIMTREALETPGKNNGVTAIETRRILDYISRTLSGNILSITKESTEPELHRLVYGLAQIAAEVSIVSALKDITYSKALSKKQAVDVNLRKKRSIAVGKKTEVKTMVTSLPPKLYDMILNKSGSIQPHSNGTKLANVILVPDKPFSVIPANKEIHVLKTDANVEPLRGFLNNNETILKSKKMTIFNNTEPIILTNKINTTRYQEVDKNSFDITAANNTGDDWSDMKETLYKAAANSESAVDIDLEDETDPEIIEKKLKLKMERLEAKAKRAILYGGDVAYLVAASVVALRRALTASIEVQMSVKYAKTGMASHQDLMMNLARTAAQQAGKEAKNAALKSQSCEKVMKLALKYTSQSNGAKLNHVANRIIMDILPLGTLAKSMAFVASDIAINSLYQASDVKSTSL